VITEAACLVFDMANPVDEPPSEADAVGQWYEWTLTANPRGAMVMHGVSAEADILAGRCYWIADSAVVRYETESHFYDDTNTQILTKMVFALMWMGQLQGAARSWRALVAGRGAGACTLRISSRRVKVDLNAPETWTSPDIAVTSSTGDLEFRPQPQRCDAFDITIEEIASANLTEGYKVKHLGFEVGADGRLRRVNFSQRV
jgi:hypothetical protein